MRLVERFEDPAGVWEIQRDPDTKEMICRVLVDPAPEQVVKQRVDTLANSQVKYAAVIAQVDAIDRANLTALRAEVKALVKQSIGYDQAVRGIQEYEKLTKGGGSSVDGASRGPGAAEPIPVAPRSR